MDHVFVATLWVRASTSRASGLQARDHLEVDPAPSINISIQPLYYPTWPTLKDKVCIQQQAAKM
jgi:hypothetical protein